MSFANAFSQFYFSFGPDQVENIRAVFKKELDIPIVEIADPNAKLDGGDVLFTGKVIVLLILVFPKIIRLITHPWNRKRIFRRAIAMDERSWC